MKIKKQRNGYYAAVMRGGKTVSLRTKVFSEAREAAKSSKLALLETATRSGQVNRHHAGPSLVDVIAQWEEWAESVAMSPLSIRRNRGVMDNWAEKLNAISFEQITEKEINSFVNAKGPSSAATRNRQLAAIRSLYNFASARGMVAGNIAKNARINLRALTHSQREVKQVQPFTPKEVATLIASADEFWRSVIGISYATALRLGDVIQLEWDCLKVPHHIVVWTEKRDRRVILPINEEVTPGLAGALAAVPYDPSDYLFPAAREVLLDPPRRARFSVYFGRLCQKAGIEGKSFHSLRHSRISEWKKAGFSLDECRDYAGHKSTKTTEGYVHG